MRILLTGAAGFIGSHLSEALIKEGNTIIGIDNLITGSLDNIKHIPTKNFQFIKVDVNLPVKISGELDYVLHFASPASPVDYLSFPIETLKVGSIGTYNCLELARLKNAKFMLASTSEVYGDPLIHPQVESYWGNVNPIGVRSCYDEAKRFAEAITFAYRREYKLNIKIIRIFNTYGERMQSNDGRVVPNFITQALAGKSLTVYGNGDQTRSFCYVSDLVEGILKLVKADIHEPVNLGDPTEMSILDFAKLIIKLTKSKSKIVFKPLPLDDPKMRKPDIRRAKKLLSWKPQVSFKDGLARTIAWFKNTRK